MDTGDPCERLVQPQRGHTPQVEKHWCRGSEDNLGCRFLPCLRQGLVSCLVLCLARYLAHELRESFCIYVCFTTDLVSHILLLCCFMTVRGSELRFLLLQAPYTPSHLSSPVADPSWYSMKHKTSRKMFLIIGPYLFLKMNMKCLMSPDIYIANVSYFMEMYNDMYKIRLNLHNSLLRKTLWQKEEFLPVCFWVPIKHFSICL